MFRRASSRNHCLHPEVQAAESVRSWSQGCELSISETANAFNGPDMTLDAQQPTSESFPTRYPPKDPNTYLPSIRPTGHDRSQFGSSSDSDNETGPVQNNTPRSRLSSPMSQGNLAEGSCNTKNQPPLRRCQEIHRRKSTVSISQRQEISRHSFEEGDDTHFLANSLRRNLLGTTGENAADAYRPTLREEFNNMNGILKENFQLSTDNLAPNAHNNYDYGLRRSKIRGTSRPHRPSLRKQMSTSMRSASEVIYRSKLRQLARRNSTDDQRRGYGSRLQTTPVTGSPQQVTPSTLPISTTVEAGPTQPRTPSTTNICKTTKAVTSQQRTPYMPRICSPLRESCVPSVSSSSSLDPETETNLHEQLGGLNEHEGGTSAEVLRVHFDTIFAGAASSPASSPSSSSPIELETYSTLFTPHNATELPTIHTLNAKKQAKVIGFKPDLTPREAETLLQGGDKEGELLKRGRSMRRDICGIQKAGCLDGLRKGWRKAKTKTKEKLLLWQRKDLDEEGNERQNSFNRDPEKRDRETSIPRDWGNWWEE